MKIYSVGGAVRDELLGLPVKDRDYVVVGASPEEMVKLGYRPVGKDFPVFLHPKTHEEYALARTERKVARGYRGFEISASPDVTLEQDLARRDLTINAIAKDEQGGITDPYQGAADLKAGVLRHVSPAFTEDPVRILRVARFAARFGFAIAPETRALMHSMVEAGEADALVAERVWQEVASGLMELRPSRMFRVLRECGALGRVMPEIDALFDPGAGGGAAFDALDAAAQAGSVLEVRFAVLARTLAPQAVEVLAERLRAPAACRDLALLAARHSRAIADAAALDAETLIELLNAADAWRRPGRFTELMTASFIAGPGALAARARLARAWQAAAAVDAGKIAQAAGKDDDIRDRINAARLAAVRGALEHR